MNPRLSALEENVWKNRNKNTLCALMEDRVKFQEGSNDSSSAPIVHHNPVDGAAPRRPSLKQTSIPNVTEIPDASSTQNNGVIAADELTLNIPAVWDDIFPTIDESVYDRYYSNSIQDYELISPIGVEETAFIYLAKFIPSGEYIALRYTDLTIAPDAEFLDELLEHVKNTKLNRHHCILPFYASFVESERLWTVTYPMRGGSLKSIVKNHFPQGLSEKLVATIIKQVLKALIYMHNQGLIHGNIRANHILLDCSGEVRITGLTSCLSLISKSFKIQKNAFSFIGLPDWMAPEMMGQNRPFDTKVDIYSLGIAARELLTGSTPFEGWPPLKIMFAKLAPHYCKALAYVPMVSNQCQDFLQKCCHPFPSQRPTALQLLQHPFIVKYSRNAALLKSKIIKKLDIPDDWFTEANISRPSSPAKSFLSSNDSINYQSQAFMSLSNPSATVRPKTPIKLMDDFFVDPDEEMQENVLEQTFPDQEQTDLPAMESHIVE